MRVNVGLIHAWTWLLEFLLVVIPFKLVTANFVGKSTLASAAYSVL